MSKVWEDVEMTEEDEKIPIVIVDKDGNPLDEKTLKLLSELKSYPIHEEDSEEEEEDIDSLIEMERERQYERIQRSIETCGDA